MKNENGLCKISITEIILLNPLLIKKQTGPIILRFSLHISLI